MTELPERQRALITLVDRINPACRQPKFTITQPGDPKRIRQWLRRQPRIYTQLKRGDTRDES